MVDLWGETVVGDHWNLCFSRDLNDWELSNVETFFHNDKIS